MKSPPGTEARTPAKAVMVLEKSTDGSVVLALFLTLSSPSAVVSVLSQVSTLLAVGPVSRLPSTVGVTRMPLPFSSGIRKMVCLAFSPSDLSSSRYSPARGMTPKMSSPESLAISSTPPPAQFMRYLQSIC